LVGVQGMLIGILAWFVNIVCGHRDMQWSHEINTHCNEFLRISAKYC
jgi:hypothetical protein